MTGFFGRESYSRKKTVKKDRQSWRLRACTHTHACEQIERSLSLRSIPDREESARERSCAFACVDGMVMPEEGIQLEALLAVFTGRFSRSPKRKDRQKNRHGGAIIEPASRQASTTKAITIGIKT